MLKSFNRIFLISFLIVLAFSCGKTEADKQAEKEKNDNLIKLLAIANRPASCKFYGTTGGCNSSVPYSCPNSTQCTSSSTCSNISCDIITADVSANIQSTTNFCDSSDFLCYTKTSSAQ